MGTLGARSLAAALSAVGIVLGVAFGAGMVRLLPWMFAPEVPLEVAFPFAQALGAKAAETAFLVGTPVGFAFAAAVWVERGEARALHALGVSPARLGAATAPHAFSAAILSFVIGLVWGSSADSPGRFAGQLVREARQSCVRATSPKSATVPLVGVTWLCFPGQEPRVTGALPGSGGRAWFSAAELTPSGDLSEVTLVDLRLATRKDSETAWRLDLHAGSGVVRGLPSWGRSARLPYSRRGILVALTLFVTSLGCSFVMLRFSLVRRWKALVVAGAPGIIAVLGLSRLDASTLPLWTYLLIPCAALFAAAASGALLHRFVRGPPAVP